jgi:integrase
VKDSGLPRVRLHDLRHGFGTIALGSGVAVRIVSDLPGHSSSAFTADVCMHVDGAMAEAATSAITGRSSQDDFAASVTKR